jgi:hypothetical protein
MLVLTNFLVSSLSYKTIFLSIVLALVDTAQPATPSVNNVGHDDMQLALLGDVPPLVDIQNVQPTESGEFARVFLNHYNLYN